MKDLLCWGRKCGCGNKTPLFIWKEEFYYIIYINSQEETQAKKASI